MPFSGELKNEQMLRAVNKLAPSFVAEYATIASQALDTVETETGATGKKIKTGKKRATGTICVLVKLNGKTVSGEKEGGLVVGRQYWIREISATEIALANTKSQAETSEAECIEYTVALKTTTEFAILTEHTGAKTERKKLTWEGSAANGIIKTSAAVEIEATSAVTVKWIMVWSAVTTGTLAGVQEVTEKVLAEADIYKITSVTLEDLAAA